jgi:hypothetical protein
MRKILQGFLLSVLLVSGSALAVEWGPWTQVKEVYITTSGVPFITLDSLPGCYNEQGAYLKGSDVDRAYSTMLAAYMAKKRVRPLYAINENSTGWSMCTITSFFIKD